MTTIIAYHGSNAKFTKFDQGKARIMNDFYGGGVAYFTSEISVAKSYANSMFKSKGGDRYIYECKLNLKKIFDVDHTYSGKELTKFFDPKDAEDFARGAGVMTMNSNKYTVIGKMKDGEYELTGDQVFRGLSRGMVNTAKARQKLIDLGYDGLRYNGDMNMGMATKHDVYLIYNADDIKIEKTYKVVVKAAPPGSPKKMVAESMHLVSTQNIKIPQSGLNYSRKMMPQLGPLEAFLKNLDGHGIKHKIEIVDSHKLKASQGEFNKDIIANIMVAPKQVKSGVIISNDNYVLDGHHRWLAAYNKDEKIKVVRVDLPILELIRLVKSFDNTSYKCINSFRSVKNVIQEAAKSADYK